MLSDFHGGSERFLKEYHSYFSGLTRVTFRTPTAAPVFLFHKGGTLNCWRTPDLVGPFIRCVIVVRIK